MYGDCFFSVCFDDIVVSFYVCSCAGVECMIIPHEKVVHVFVCFLRWSWSVSSFEESFDDAVAFNNGVPLKNNYFVCALWHDVYPGVSYAGDDPRLFSSQAVEHFPFFGFCPCYVEFSFVVDVVEVVWFYFEFFREYVAEVAFAASGAAEDEYFLH